MQFLTSEGRKWLVPGNQREVTPSFFSIEQILHTCYGADFTPKAGDRAMNKTESLPSRKAQGHFLKATF